MLLKISQVGEAVLRRRAAELTPAQIGSREIRELIERMRSTMYDAPGVGLAAPQIGVPLQIAVIEDKPEYQKGIPAEVLQQRERKPVPFQVIINPKIELLSESDVEFFEGCLSLAGFTAVVARAYRVRVSCLDHLGQPKVIDATGWYARILQHEIDHLHGTLYIDRMDSRTFMALDAYNRHWKDASVTDLRESLRHQ